MAHMVPCPLLKIHASDGKVLSIFHPSCHFQYGVLGFGAHLGPTWRTWLEPNLCKIQGCHCFLEARCGKRSCSLGRAALRRHPPGDARRPPTWCLLSANQGASIDSHSEKWPEPCRHPTSRKWMLLACEMCSWIRAPAVRAGTFWHSCFHLLWWCFCACFGLFLKPRKQRW